MEAIMELLAIERELKGPNGRAAMEKHDRVLVALGERLQTALREGLPPEEFSRCAELDEANTVARKLIRIALRKNDNF